MFEFLLNCVSSKVALVFVNWFLAFLVISVRSAMHSILWLVSLFIVSALIFVGFFNLYFIGILFIIVYVGAVTVLFLFIIIIIPLKEIEFSGNRFFIHGSTIRPLVFFVGLVCLVFASGFYFFEYAGSELPTFNLLNSGYLDSINDLDLVGQTIYYKYSFSLIVAALLLFVALVIAILLCADL